MGNCTLRIDQYDPTVSISKDCFVLMHPIGKGGFGKVWKVQHKKSKEVYAMKKMLKARVVSKRSVHSVMNERQLLSLLKHPFLINMHFAFQDSENLYLVMDYLSGGDLRYHLGIHRKFSEAQTKFFVACLVTSLEFLHLNNIIHRDVKPENLVLEANGYVRLTDMGIARVLQPENSNETSGTPGYMAPEILCRQNHGIPVDYFAVGVIVYEFMTGRRPYLGRNRKEIRDAVLARQVQLKKDDIPEGWSAEAVDFCNKLIQRKPQNRLGVNGPLEVKSHAWLRDFPWERLITKSLEAPFIPNKAENFDTKHVNNDWKDESAVATVKQSLVAGLFPGYFFDENFQTQEKKVGESTLNIDRNN